MSDGYFWLKTVHILSATVLFGTGIGTAFQMWFAHRSGDTHAIATVARNVVLADLLFTTPAIIVQPLTGGYLIWLSGIDPLASWLVAVYTLYALAGACWLPVVWLQVRARNMARSALQAGKPLPPAYHRCMTLWFGLGWPAFAAVVVIFWLMTTKPTLW